MFLKKFVRSLRLDMTFLYVVLTDMAYYAVLLLSVIWYVPRYIMPKLGELYATISQVRQAADIVPDAIAPNLNILSISVLIRIIIFVLFFIILNTCAKGTIWSIILKQRPSQAKYLNILLVNLIIFFLMFVIFYYGPKMLSTNVLTVVLLVLLPIIWHLVMASHLFGARNSFVDAVTQPFVQFHHFILPYIIIILMLALVVIISVLLTIARTRIISVFILIFFIAFFNWTKIFLAESLQD